MSLQEDQTLPPLFISYLLVFFSVVLCAQFLIGVLGWWTRPMLLIGFFGCVAGMGIVLGAWTKELLFSLKFKPFFHAIIFSIYIFTLLLHGINVFTPETGFDALWYHLPIIKTYGLDQHLSYQAERYQSLYPQYGDIFLLFGYSAYGVIGSKIITYIFFVLLVYSVYRWLRDTLSTSNSLLGSLVVCYFQVVSWQASSAYVDGISTVFFLWSMYFLVSYTKSKSTVKVLLSAIASGIFFGTKFINLGYLPLFICITLICLSVSSLKTSVISKVYTILTWWLVASVIASVWYLRAWWYTGSLIYPVGTIYADPVIQQMGVAGWGEWLRLRLLTLWKLPHEFFFKNDGYTTPLLLLFAPLLYTSRKLAKETIVILLIGLYGLLFWFFFPPPSTRYVLGPVIVLWIGLYAHAFSTIHSEKNNSFLRYVVLIVTLPFLLIRVFIATRSLPYVLGWETQAEYLNRFRNGFLDEKIDAFYYDHELEE